MSDLKLFSLVLMIFIMPLSGCGGAADAGPKDASAGMCGCSRPSDCSSGICCVDYTANFGGSAASACAATANDCRIFLGVDGGKTIACDKDSDCQDQTSDDGGVGLSCAKNADPAFCGARLCFSGRAAHADISNCKSPNQS